MATFQLHARSSRLIGAFAVLAFLASCGGTSGPSTVGDGPITSSVSNGDGAGSAETAGDDGGSPFAQVEVADGASVDADREGGDELSGVSFAAMASAVCTTGERVGVVPAEVDRAEVEDWTNATEEPVVYVDPDDVTGDIDGLPSCSMAYEQDEIADTLLHGDHMHAAHS